MLSLEFARAPSPLALAVLALLLGGAPSPAEASPAPGSYTVTLKGQLPDGSHFVRLAMYSFQPDGTLRQDFWLWNSRSATQYGSTGLQVGYAYQSSYPYNIDQDKYIQGISSFHGGESSLTTLFGTWRLSGNTLTLTWSWGDRETWNVTWKDAGLYKIEATSATYTSGGFYLSPSGVRTPNAANAGWGFGGPGPGFTVGASMADSDKDYTGLLLRYNAWSGAQEPVAADSMCLLSCFYTTNTGVQRYVFWGNGHNVFAYAARPASNPGMLARRITYQVSHDFNNNGHIADNIGHTYAGLQILDAFSRVRGFVFGDSSPASSSNTISALYYLDDGSWDAMYGVDPDVAGR